MSPVRWVITFIVVFLLACVVVLGWFTAMPLHSYSGAFKPLSQDEAKIRDDTKGYVTQLAEIIGKRNLDYAYDSLKAAASFIETTLRSQGYDVHSYEFSVDGNAVRNLEVQIPGARSPDKNLIVGAHYDTFGDAPGADDNASGIAALLELAAALKNSKPDQTIRLVFFVNEEPPNFQTDKMGSLVYAKQLHDQKVDVTGMISLETIGYYSDAEGSQEYPAGFGVLYPYVGNFIGFVGNVGSRSLVRRAVRAFRQSAEFPSEGVAAPASLTGIAWSDQWSFWQQGYKAIMVTDTAPFRNHSYHLASDTPEKLDYDRMARVVAGLQKAMLKLAEND
ncbi:MAG TPA: M20/M25/M40 family metallo-hydrolase [Candidatus Angelobacter sp.]